MNRDGTQKTSRPVWRTLGRKSPKLPKSEPHSPCYAFCVWPLSVSGHTSYHWILWCCRPCLTWSSHTWMPTWLVVDVCWTAVHCAAIQRVPTWRSSLHDHRKLLTVCGKLEKWKMSNNEDCRIIICYKWCIKISLWGAHSIYFWVVYSTILYLIYILWI